ncbi:MAG TPA: type I methionyl aminopeptidase [Candidatus Portnoybacteria bacterium]|jgi:methionyl aminopeptidase|nr:type I methionyl aminopeptidase [Candidatus Portnoybacteria bacterium]MDD5751932.1 type I methionyl aminopeptidase [Candidatus Portnoybacteria bacterium]HNU96693.1 type I methionyl aminopeptidase [Candidatus Portnoybacteria bacterium]HOZ16264.1 type I methionyl aminopeptidase [Candidatus Portnoybacteria bacterium]HPH51940.1 type I methionyl aminopeptidase [Candidatus Portnoybacteria bacterium]
MINLYTEKEIEIMAEGGKILAKIIKEVAKHAKIGTTTKELDKVAEDLIFRYGAKPAFKGFNNYPAVLCASVNEEVVHAIPNDRKLKEGDLLTLDLGINYKNYCTDMAITIGIGKIDKKFQKLIDVTEKSLELAIKQCKPGNRLGDIGFAIQSYVEKNGFNVIRDLVGHGIGKKVHEEPEVLNYGEKATGIVLKPGMVIAIEPMNIVGSYEVERAKDGFAFLSKDRSISAHFEHTVAITKKGCRVLTK